eukprot:7941897-Pyramimonas_sp.AAC.1
MLGYTGGGSGRPRIGSHTCIWPRLLLSNGIQLGSNGTKLDRCPAVQSTTSPTWRRPSSASSCPPPCPPA